jgi:hypothetical protein
MQYMGHTCCEAVRFTYQQNSALLVLFSLELRYSCEDFLRAAALLLNYY